MLLGIQVLFHRSSVVFIADGTKFPTVAYKIKYFMYPYKQEKINGDVVNCFFVKLIDSHTVCHEFLSGRNPPSVIDSLRTYLNCGKILCTDYKL